MIRIRFKSKEEYQNMRQMYLKEIYKYVEFDKEDILNIKDDSRERPVSNKTGMWLKTAFPNLYKFLYNTKTNQVNSEHLRLLLAGPEEPPASFFGEGGNYDTMMSVFDFINKNCIFPKDLKKNKRAKNVCKIIFRYSAIKTKLKNMKPRANTCLNGTKELPYKILEVLNIRVCPYCNRLYTITIPINEKSSKESGENAIRPEFDHYYPQSKYPFLALSLFNLIPCCHVCNRRKREREKEIYPYDEEFGKKVVFRLIPKSAEQINYLWGQSDDFDVTLQPKKADEPFMERVQNSIDHFMLGKLYDEHKPEVRDILRNAYYFNESYLKIAILPTVKKLLNNSVTESNNSTIDLDDMISNMLLLNQVQQQNWGCRPLSKLVADILEQLQENQQ